MTAIFPSIAAVYAVDGESPISIGKLHLRALPERQSIPEPGDTDNARRGVAS